MTDGTGNQEEYQRFDALVNSAFDLLHDTAVTIIRNAGAEGRDTTEAALGISHAGLQIAAWFAAGTLVVKKADALMEITPTMWEERLATAHRLVDRMSAALRGGVEEEAKVLGIPGPVTRTLAPGSPRFRWPGKLDTA